MRFYLSEHSNFCADADGFLQVLHRAVAVWHGTGPLDLPPIGDPGQDLTGFDGSTDLSFPRAMPEWQPGCRPAKQSLATQAGEWGMVALSIVIMGVVTALGQALFGQAGGLVGALCGFVAAGAVVWRWARRQERRPPT